MEDKIIEVKEKEEAKETKYRDIYEKLMEKIAENNQSKGINKTESEIKAELQKMNSIFKKVSDKYKDQKEEYLLNKTVKELIDGIISSNKEFKEEIEKDTYFLFDNPTLYIQTGKKKYFIEFLVEAKIFDDNGKEFSFWVCSYDYLKEKLQDMGYKEAKLNKKALFKNIEENGKDTDNSSSETIESQYNLDIKLTQYEVKANKCILSLEDIFSKSQEIFAPLDNTDNINSYIKDLNIPKSINNSNFKFNNNYRTDLFDIICSHKNCITSYFYNEKSGLTLSLLHALEKSRKLKEDFRYLYLNSEYIKRYKKKYFIFRMAKLFKKDEEEAFIALFKSKDEEKANFNSEYIIDCLNMVLKYLKNIYIIFDNIKSPETYEIVNYLISKINPLENSTILLFFRINTYTISSIENIKSFSNKIISLLPNDNSSNQELPPEAYFDSKIKGWTDEDKEQYQKDIQNIINNINTIDYFIFLIKLLYNESFSQNNSLTISDFNNYLEKFLPLLYISICKENCKTSINKIQFRTNFIKETIEYQFNYLLSKNLLTDKIFKEIKTKSTEGIYIEKEIIFYLITKLIKLDKITIEKIYCFDSKLNKNLQILVLFLFKN